MISSPMCQRPPNSEVDAAEIATASNPRVLAAASQPSRALADTGASFSSRANQVPRAARNDV